MAGVGLLTGRRYACRALIITPGTFLNGLIHLGSAQYPGGRSGRDLRTAAGRFSPGEGPSGWGRMKTGTPPRVHRRSVDLDPIGDSTRG